MAEDTYSVVLDEQEEGGFHIRMQRLHGAVSLRVWKVRATAPLTYTDGVFTFSPEALDYERLDRTYLSAQMFGQGNLLVLRQPDFFTSKDAFEYSRLMKMLFPLVEKFQHSQEIE